MHILNNFVTAQCFLLLLFYPDAERVIWMRSSNSELAYLIGNIQNKLGNRALKSGLQSTVIVGMYVHIYS